MDGLDQAGEASHERSREARSIGQKEVSADRLHDHVVAWRQEVQVLSEARKVRFLIQDVAGADRHGLAISVGEGDGNTVSCGIRPDDARCVGVLDGRQPEVRMRAGGAVVDHRGTVVGGKDHSVGEVRDRPVSGEIEDLHGHDAAVPAAPRHSESIVGVRSGDRGDTVPVIEVVGGIVVVVGEVESGYQLAAKLRASEVDAGVEDCDDQRLAGFDGPRLGPVDVRVRRLVVCPLLGEQRIVGNIHACQPVDVVRFGDIDLGEPRDALDHFQHVCACRNVELVEAVEPVACQGLWIACGRA